MPDTARIKVLLQKHLQQGLTDSEQSELDACLQASPPFRILFDQLTDETMLQKKLAFFGSIPDRPATIPRRSFIARYRWLAAASVLLALGTGLFFWMQDGKQITPPETAIQQDIAPGREGAILTLADGSEVLLDTVKNGVVSLQGGRSAKIVNGGLVYEGNEGQLTYNTMTTPRGRQFQITLPDGSKVWLNSTSSIRYPTLFNGATREVSITGEAYFEVRQNAGKPFLVKMNNELKVEVLGTHFNINAYDNEAAVHTTLLEGSVRISKYILQPGEQAQIERNTGSIRIVKDADMDKVMAWKNGLFNFNGSSLREIMRQLERWYDVEVVFEGNVPDKTFYGEIDKDNNLRGVLNALEKTGVHYRLEGRRLILLP